MAAAVTALVSVPVLGSKRHRLYAFSDRVTILHTQTTFEEVLNYGSAGIGFSAGCNMVQSPTLRERWATTVFENKIYFTNIFSPIRVVSDHPYVFRIGGGSVTPPFNDIGRIPAAKYIDTFFDHLVVANVDYQGRYPNRLQWSDLYHFNIWNTSRKNEADHYDLLESKDSAFGGITGLGKIETNLYSYTSSGIWVSQYVGLPGVIRTEQLIPDVGNDFEYGLITTERLHFFISEKWRNIFAFDGMKLTPIGDDIIEFFLADLTTDVRLRQLTWGYVDYSDNELVWCYVPTGQTTFVREIVFNLLRKKWYTRSAENLTAFSNGARTSKKIVNYTGSTIDSLAGTIVDDLGNDLDRFTKVWGDAVGNILVEGGPSSIEADLPVLETNDFLYGDLTTLKEIEDLLIQAVLGTASGIDVYTATRQNLDDPITYVKLPQLWTPLLKEGRLTFPRKSGRIIRYKFIPKPTSPATSVDGFKWTNYTEFVYNAKAEK